MAATAPELALPAVGGRVERSGPALWLYTLMKFVRQKPLGAVGGFIVLVMLVTAFAAPLIATHGYDERDYRALLQGPSTSHFLGTDDVGRDMFSRIVYGARVSIIISFGAVAMTTLIAGSLGIAGGYFGGKTDLIIQRLVDIKIAFPGLLFLIVLASVFKTPTRPQDVIPGPLDWNLQPAEIRMAQIIFALGITLSGGASRVIRSAVIGIRYNQYMESARALGAGHLRIILRYVLPNVMPTMLVIATVQLGAAILIESSLSFLQFGIPPPVPAWGSMLGGNATRFINRAPLLAVWPGLAISLAVFGFNMLGDALRDVLDPRLRGTR